MYGRVFFVALGLVAAVGTAVIYGLGAQMVISGTITIGTLVALAAYVGRVYGPLTSLTNARVDVMTALVSFERVFEVLDAPNPLEDSPGAIDLIDPVGRVEFDDVSFTYPAGSTFSVASLEVGEHPGRRQTPVARRHARCRGAAPRLGADRAGAAHRADRTVGRGQDDDRVAGPSPVRRDRRRGPRRRVRRARPDAALACAPRSASSCRILTSSTSPSPTTCATRIPKRPRTSSRRPAAPRRSTTSSPRCPRATTRSSASAATGSRAARSSGSRSHACC